MKKLFLISLIFILIIGCGKKEENLITFDNSYYQVASDFKKGVGSYTLRSYDKSEVESMLMFLSKEHFNTSNLYYQEGQYLNNDILKELLNKYNETDILLNDSKTKPQFITTIYEQNYVTNNGGLKGISLAIVLSKDQKYITDKTYTQTYSEKEVLDHAKEKVNDLIKYLRTIDDIKNTKIVVGLYIEGKDYLKGSFKYVGNTNKDSINLEYVNYSYKLLNSSDVLNNDLKNYNNFDLLTKELVKQNVFFVGLGLYKDKTLINCNITISNNYLSTANILQLSSITSKQLSNFDSNIKIKTYFKSSNKLKALLEKEGLEFKINIVEE